jgi:hypothetical protein
MRIADYSINRIAGAAVLECWSAGTDAIIYGAGGSGWQTVPGTIFGPAASQNCWNVRNSWALALAWTFL